jgi:alkylation response protein AidB-like acyl-CoA dehydrogenase
MYFELNEDQMALRDEVRKWSRQELLPNAGQWDRDGEVPFAVFEQMAELGLMGVNVPEDVGGSQMGAVALSLAMQEIAYGCASTSVVAGVTNMVAEVINHFGKEEQRRTYLPRITSGERPVGAFALSEAGSGSDAGAMKTTAVKKGDRWIVNGEKMWITSGAYAGVFVLWARTGGKDLPGTRGVSAFLVEPEFPGFSVGRHEDKMGIRGSNTTALIMEDCEVPEENLLGELDRGFRIAMMALDGGRIGIASQALGISRAALDEAVEYARERRQFGRPITSFQDIQWMLADSATEIAAADGLTMRAAYIKEAGRPFSRQAAMAKYYTSEAAQRVCARCFQVHGGYGYVKEFPIERHLRDVRVTTIYEGTSQVQKLVISRNILEDRT